MLNVHIFAFSVALQLTCRTELIVLFSRYRHFDFVFRIGLFAVLDYRFRDLFPTYIRNERTVQGINAILYIIAHSND